MQNPFANITFSSFSNYIFAVMLIGIGGFMTLCGGMAMFSSSIGLIGILVFMPGIILTNQTINVLIVDKRKRKIGKIIIYTSMILWILIAALDPFKGIFPPPAPSTSINEIDL